MHQHWRLLQGNVSLRGIDASWSLWRRSHQKMLFGTGFCFFVEVLFFRVSVLHFFFFCLKDFSAADAPCRQAGGTCVEVSSCQGTARKGLCGGGRSRQCCIASDARCSSVGGTCMEVSDCKGAPRKGLCPGSASFQCCVPQEVRTFFVLQRTRFPVFKVLLFLNRIDVLVPEDLAWIPLLARDLAAKQGFVKRGEREICSFCLQGWTLPF
jgi:hypothetical protein